MLQNYSSTLAPTCNGKCIQLVAASRGLCLRSVDSVRLLLSRGADINWSGERGEETLCDVAVEYGQTATAAWLARIRAGGWVRHLSEPRYQLVVLRALAARGDARRERAFYGKEQVLDLLFPGGRANTRAKRDQPRLPDDVFSVIACYYWAAECFSRRRPPPPAGPLPPRPGRPRRTGCSGRRSPTSPNRRSGIEHRRRRYHWRRRK
mmetsp:Transcript_8761/g.26189  ORF Transcript_8761/g.26189 Transcript_8761/m.26189 type:complete len:207 (+) Transcript_8761:214-834(+)